MQRTVAPRNGTGRAASTVLHSRCTRPQGGKRLPHRHSRNMRVWAGFQDAINRVSEVVTQTAPLNNLKKSIAQAQARLCPLLTCSRHSVSTMNVQSAPAAGWPVQQGGHPAADPERPQQQSCKLRRLFVCNAHGRPRPHHLSHPCAAGGCVFLDTLPLLQVGSQSCVAGSETWPLLT